MARSLFGSLMPLTDPATGGVFHALGFPRPLFY